MGRPLCRGARRRTHIGGASAPRDTTKRIWAQSRVRYARKHHGPLVAVLEAVGVALGALTHAAVWWFRPRVRARPCDRRPRRPPRTSDLNGLMDTLTYAIITPARNERENLTRLAESVIAQRVLPACWVIVDDGSDDGMEIVAAELAAATTGSWSRRRARTPTTSPRAGAADAICSRSGAACARCPRPSTSSSRSTPTRRSSPTTSRSCSRASPSDPQLGIAGGCCYELEDGRWERMKVAGSHPRGASRAYRWALADVVEELEPELGWDGVDEVMAELRGYRTAGFQDFGFRHHRKVGEREGRLRAGAALGRQAWYMGYRPSYLHAARGLPRAGELRRPGDGLGVRGGGGVARAAVPASERDAADPGEPATARGGAARRLDVASLRGAGAQTVPERLITRPQSHERDQRWTRSR